MNTVVHMIADRSNHFLFLVYSTPSTMNINRTVRCKCIFISTSNKLRTKSLCYELLLTIAAYFAGIKSFKTNNKTNSIMLVKYLNCMSEYYFKPHIHELCYELLLTIAAYSAGIKIFQTKNKTNSIMLIKYLNCMSG